MTSSSASEVTPWHYKERCEWEMEANNEGVSEGDQCHEGYLAAPDAG